MKRGKVMKKKLFILTLTMIGCFCISGCTENLNTIKELEYDQVKEKIDRKESFILEVIQTGCSHCEEFSPRLKKILAENHITAYSMNLHNLTDEQKKEFKEISYVSGTPTVIFFTEGEEETSHKIVGAVSNKNILAHLKDMGYIK